MNLENNHKNLSNSQSDNIWFFVPHEQWFLNRSLQDLIEGYETWFNESRKAGKETAKKKKRINIKDVTIQIADNSDLLQQYYNLREEAYKKEWGFAEYSGQENDFDRRGKIVVVVDDNQVVGGARIGFSDKGLLSNEAPEKNFTYQEICKKSDINLDSIKYAEISGVVVIRNTNHALLGKMFDIIIDYCRKLDIKYLFGVSTKKCNVNYCKTFKKINIQAFSIDEVFAPVKPQYNNILMNPIVAIL